MIDHTTLARPSAIFPGTPIYKRIINSPEWVAQLKVDGWRVLIEKKRNGALVFTTRHGERLEPTRDIASAVDLITPACSFLDVELERPWKKIWVIDVMELAGMGMLDQPLANRLVRAGSVLSGGSMVEMIPTIRDRKEDYYNAVIEAGGEGIVLKKLMDPYPRGGIVWLKVKSARN